ncbi:MAG: tetratricopeptide repeat protein [Clostridia bacterium]|nr:tetratricopeptide repeat protein [Clostridia bacterium]
MAEELNIDYSEERLLKVAANLLDDNDFVGAARMVTRSVELHGESAEAFSEYARIYMRMDLAEDALNAWYRALMMIYLNTPEDEDVDSDRLPEIYDGLMRTLLKLGYTNAAEEYCSRFISLLSGDENSEPEELLETIMDELYGDLEDEFGDDFDEEDLMDFGYEDEDDGFDDESDDDDDDDDGEEHVSKGLGMLESGHADEAIEEFEKVDEQSGEYLMARSCMAMAYYTQVKYDEAEAICREVLAADENFVPALTVLASVLGPDDETGEGMKIARHLSELDMADDEDIAKAVPVVMTFGLYEEALAMLDKHSKRYVYDVMTMNFKAACLCNLKRFDEAKGVLRDILYVHPDACQIKYKLDGMLEELGEGGEPHLPIDYWGSNEKSISCLEQCFSYLQSGSAKRKTYDLPKLHETLEWLMDPYIGPGDVLINMVFESALSAGFDDIVRKLLTDFRISDHVKISMIEKICQQNRERDVFVVCGMALKWIQLYHIKLGRTKRKLFLDAVSMLIARMAVIDEDFSYDISDGCEILYEYCKSTELLDELTEDDRDTLMAAIYCWSGLETLPVTKAQICKFFGGKPRLYKKLVPKKR